MTEWLAGNRIIGTSAEKPIASLQSPSVGGWVEVARHKLGSDQSTIDVSWTEDKRYYMILMDYTQTSDFSGLHRLGNSSIDPNNNYHNRQSSNGATDASSQATYVRLDNGWQSGDRKFVVEYIADLANKEKLIINHMVRSVGTGAGTATQRSEVVSKWVPSTASDTIGVFQMMNGGNYAGDSEVVVLGWSPTDTHTTNFWEELANVDYQGGSALVASTPTFASKKYLWVQAYVKQASGYASGMTFNGDTTRGSTNYAFRYSANGGADATPHENTWASIKNYSSLAGGGYFFNAFIINNASNEKLVIGTTSENPATGAGTSPNTMQTSAKWNDATNPITKVNIIGENGSGNISNGTQIRVWGSN